MSWLTVIWSMVASACLTLGLVHSLVWWGRRVAWANLVFASTTVSAALFAACELWMMRAPTPEQYGEVLRWCHVPGSFLVISIVLFIRVYFQAGRPWLFWSACGVRSLALILNFVLSPNLNFLKITAVRHIPFLGEFVSIPVGVPSPWMLVGNLSFLLAIAFIADATITVWHRGERRRALFVGGSILFFSIASSSQTMLALWGLVNAPLAATPFYLCIVAVMEFELSRDMLRVQKLSDDLRESETRMTLATEAASLGIWIQDLVRSEIWATDRWRALIGFSASERIEFDEFLEKLHPEDRQTFNETRSMALNGAGRYEMQYRVIHAQGEVRWIASRGSVEFNRAGQAVLIRGVAMDITDRKLAELKLLQQRNELAHLSRVTTLGEISGSLAHELNQPLGAILTNTEAADMYLQGPAPELGAVRTILADVRRDAIHAGEIIHGMRAFLRRREFNMQPLKLDQLLAEASALIGAEAAARKITIGINVPGAFPRVMGDRTCLTQVVVNLLVNAMDAMATCKAPYRRIVIDARRQTSDTVEVAICDTGVGIPPDDMNRIFDAFHTSKQGGLGLGLAICRSIIEAHGGAISVTNNPDRGATALFSLSACTDNEPC
jgi:two-component system, LuxR family, sensor kinase FixL